MNKKQEMTIEECQALFFDKNALNEPAYKMYRLNNHGSGRIYYDFDVTNVPRFYTSVTELIKKTTPTSPYLIKWIADMGYEKAMEFVEERAGYGKFMHICFQKLLIDKKIDLDDELENALADHMITENCPRQMYDQWIHDIRRDVLAFAQLIMDYEIEPLAIEVILCSPKNGFAGAVDLLCFLKMDVKGFWGEVLKSGPNKGEPKETKKRKRFMAILDFKSGRKGFYEDNEIQLGAYRVLIKENFPKYKRRHIKLFNFSPKDWTSFPNYNFKDQTNSKNLAKLRHLVKLGAIESGKRDPNVMVVGGKLDMSKGVEGLEENFEHISLERFVTVKKQKNEKRPDSKKKRPGARKQTANTRKD